ncbi:conserved Plasmodium protein, unknown function [Plasmodium ovale wallikeri]|uniref:Uncharacterized protein n=1 Tax=Plasmodium ovale wallikeri TaxID=864142 RepID=A0A1A8YJB7_PLAOA|nr:conserved Plasmodium protein, unknown function [Plasmodium ovale wallikeri]
MKTIQRKAYERLVAELKSEFPFFGRYDDDFFFKRQKEDIQNSNYFDSFFEKNEQYVDTKEYCHLLMGEIEKSFSMLEKNDSIYYLCNLFLKHYKPSTNDYYDYINSNYMSSEMVQHVMKSYVEHISMKKGHTDISIHSMGKEKPKYNQNNSTKNDSGMSCTKQISEGYNKGEKKEGKHSMKRGRKRVRVHSESGGSRGSSEGSANRNRNSGKSFRGRDRWTHERGKGKHRNYFEDEIANGKDTGFCDISYIPFINASFYINYGCIRSTHGRESRSCVFMIDSVKMDESRKCSKYKRLITFGNYGKRKFLQHVSEHSIVRGWIYKSDSRHRCFLVKLFSVRDGGRPSGRGKRSRDSGRSSSSSSGRSRSRSRSSSRDSIRGGDGPSAVACLPFEFISNFEFVDDLSKQGLGLQQNSEKFLGVNICGEIFDDQSYIHSHFQEILCKHSIDCFITFQAKSYSNSDQLGFLSNNSSRNNLVDQKRNRKKYNFFFPIFNILLFSSQKFLSIENVKYKERCLLLNISNIPSLIRFNFRNHSIHMHIGGTITKKQNLIWSDKIFMEAYELYKNNSTYYHFLRNYFHLDYCTNNYRYLYMFGEDKFVMYKKNHCDVLHIESDTNLGSFHKNINKDEEIILDKEMPNLQNFYTSNKSHSVDGINEHLGINNNDDSQKGNSFEVINMEEDIINKIKFLNPRLYKTKWLYNFFNHIKLTINLNNEHVLGNFLLSLVFLELSCYTESFLFLFRLFRIKKAFLNSYKLKNIICLLFLKQLKKSIDKDILCNSIANFREYDLFCMREDNSDLFRVDHVGSIPTYAQAWPRMPTLPCSAYGNALELTYRTLPLRAKKGPFDSLATALSFQIVFEREHKRKNTVFHAHGCVKRLPADLGKCTG